jgi:murein DD-endopeptidase MepM/ murein hydrolase activator NlpD
VKGLPDVSTSYHPNVNIEQYRGRSDPEAIKAVAAEMESLLAYEMIKEMRASIGSESEKNNLGNDTYMSLFDMELAKLFVEKGLGVQDTFVKGLSNAAQKAGGGSGATTLPTAKSDQSSVPEAQKAGEGSGVTLPLPTAKSDQSSMPEAQKTGEGSGVTLPQTAVKSDQSSVPETQKAQPDHPRSSPVDGVVSSPFGMRRHPIHGDMRFHNGIDIAAPAGTNVYAIRKGTVTFSGQQAGFGNVVVIDHGNGLITKYGHNRVNLVKAGDEVDTTTVIAQVGSTGESTGPHLHFEVRFEGKSVDPRTFFAKL